MKNNFLILLSFVVISSIFVTFLGPKKNSINKFDRVATATPEQSCSALDLSGIIDFDSKTAIYNGDEIEIPKLAFSDTKSTVLGVTNSSERWVEVDLSEQKLTAREGDNVYLETRISSGLPGTPTPTGEFRIWIKLRATKMEGGQGRYYYYLPNVPYVMFFGNESVPNYKGYGLHGTYWHNDFGTPRSHGCVNLPTEIAGLLYNWTYPVLPAGKSVVYASAENPGTRIVIHE